MARDETARDADGDASLLKRRTYLKLAGAAVTSVAATSASERATAATATATDYETITVASGETFTKSLSDGETWENKLIDLTADGAGMEVFAYADNWTIRNIGVKGENHASPVNSGGSNTFWVRVNSSSATGTMENIYLGDGDGGGDSTDTREIGGAIVHPDHAGEITMNYVNVQNWSDNGIYGSPPGNPDSHTRPGKGGTVKITNSFSAKCGSAGFRIGSTGSYCRNCVAIDGHDRGFWGYYESTDYENCDASNNRIQYCAGNDGSTAEKNAEITLTNCRSEGTWTGNQCVGTINGSADSNPRRTPPDGVSTTPEGAASGSSSSSPSGTVLELVSGTDTSSISYEFTVEGTVQKVTDAGDMSADDNDTVTDNGDGTMTVTGTSGNGYGDSFAVDGTITSMTLDESKWTIYYGGEQVTVSDLVGGSSPTIDQYDVSEAGSPNPHAEIEETWQASDADADLQTVKVEVRDASGNVVRSSSVGVSGGTASGTNSFKIKHGGGATYDCVLLVTDSEGQTTSQTQTVTA